MVLKRKRNKKLKQEVLEGFGYMLKDIHEGLSKTK